MLSFRRPDAPAAGVILQDVGGNLENVAIEKLNVVRVALAYQSQKDLLDEVVRIRVVSEPALEKAPQR